MKRIICALAAAALLSSSVALADPMTIDLDGMTPKEIKELISMAEDEYKEATDIPSSDAKLLTENFKSAFESLIPKDADVSYPLFGLDKQRARTMYKLSGDCTVKFADKTKSTYSMTMIYWHEEVTKTFHQVAFYSKEKIYYCDHALLSNVAPYLSDSVLEKLGADEIVYTATSAVETPVPTATPTPSPSPSPVQMSTLVPISTPEYEKQDIQYDALQELFLSLNSNTTVDELERMIESFELPYAKSEFNKSSNGKELSYVIAYTDGAAAFKYAESGDHLEVSFDLGNNSALMLAEYSKADTAKSALFYQYGTWWDFSEQNAFDYSGYYYVNHMSRSGGITIRYKNGYEKNTNYVLCKNGEEAIHMVR